MNTRHAVCAAAGLTLAMAVSGCGHQGSGSGTRSVLPAAPPSTLVSEWPADGTYADTASGNNGSPIGGVSFGPGHSGQAFQLDGKTGRIAVNDSPSLALTGSLAITAWVEPVGYPSKEGFIFFRGDDRGGLDPYCLYLNSDGRLAFRVYGQDGRQALVTSANPVPLNSWTYVGGSLDDATGEIAVYIGGAKAGSTTSPVRPFAALDSQQNPGVGIGDAQDEKYDARFKGLIDDLRLYKSAAPAGMPPS